VNSLIDNGALVVLARRPGDYGRLRVWGAVGWGASALAVGWLVAERGPRGIFAVYVGLLVALLTVAVRLPVGERVGEGAFRARLAGLAGDRRLWRFLAVAFLGGTGVSIVNAYLPLYLLGLGAPGLVGASMLVATLSEMPVMVFGARVLARLGYGRAFLLGYAVYGGRALVMSFVHAPWGVVALQLLHGPSFAVMWISGVALARRLAPPGLGATAQGLFSSISTGLGGAVGAVAGGWIFGAIGPAGAFRTAAVLLALVAPLVALVANAEPGDPFAR
jgi:PPP family 3-phenylpropionic acid transporter